MYVKTHKTIKLSKVVDLAPFFFFFKEKQRRSGSGRELGVGIWEKWKEGKRVRMQYMRED